MRGRLIYSSSGFNTGLSESLKDIGGGVEGSGLFIKLPLWSFTWGSYPTDGLPPSASSPMIKGTECHGSLWEACWCFCLPQSTHLQAQEALLREFILALYLLPATMLVKPHCLCPGQLLQPERMHLLLPCSPLYSRVVRLGSPGAPRVLLLLPL